MTKIALVHGLPKAVSAMPAGNGSPIPFSALTEGEMLLHIAHGRLQIFRDYYPETAKQYQQAMDVLRDVVASGLHTGGHRKAFGRLNGDFRQLGNLISLVRQKTTPTTDHLHFRKDAAHVGDFIVPIPDCSQFVIENDLGYGNFQYTYLPGWQECQEEIAWMYDVNKFVQQIPHHFLYEWQTSQSQLQGLTPASISTVSAKKVLHRIGVSEFASVCKFSRPVMREFLELGLMQQNVAKGGIPATGAQTFDELKKNYAGRDLEKNPPPGINFGFWAAACIITAIIALVAATQVIVTKKGVNLKAQVKGLGSWELSPNGTDIEFPGGTFPQTDFDTDSGGFSLDQNTLLLAGGALALFALSGKK